MKRFILLALSCLFAIAWNSAVADVITTGTWTYDEDEPLVIDVSQISTNSITAEANSGAATTLDEALYFVIDEDWSTYHHSCWYSGSYDVEFGPNDPDELPYLQFDLEDEYDLLQIYIVSRASTYAAYNDCPAVVNMYGTNDADDEDSWEFVAEINFAESGAAGVQTNTEFTSEPFQSDTAYRYWRFEVAETSNNRTDDNENGDYELLFAVAEVQFYVPYEITDQAELLTLLVDSISELGLSFVASTEPGYYDSELVAAYQAAFDAAEEATYETHTDEEYIAYGNALREALAAVLAGINPLPAGFYYIVSPINFYYTSTDEDTYGENISVTKAIYEDDDALYWDTLDEEDVNYMWTVTELEDGGYALQNYGTGNYIYGTDTEYTAVPTAAELETTHYIQGIGDGTFAIYSDLSAEAYHPQGHSSGTGESGSIVIWEDEYSSDNSNVWYFEEITLTQDELDELTEQKSAQNLLDELQDLIDEANSLYSAVTVAAGEGLVIDVSQLSSNAQETSEGSLDVLLDGSTDGFFHSEWSDGTTTDYHHLQVSLYEQVDQFILLMWARSDQSSSDEVDFPSTVRIYATNDADLGADASSDSEDWEEVYLLEIENPGIDLQGYQWESDGAIEVGDAYQYFRFSVEATMSGRTNSYSGVAQPYFTLSEFQMYSVADEENAQYSYIEGMQEAVDAMMEGVTVAEETIESGVATQDDIDALQALIDAVTALYVDTEEYTTLKSTAAQLLNNAVIGTEPGSVSQEAYDALQAAYDEAVALAGTQPTNETVAEAVEILTAAIEAFNAAVIGIETGTWYYIVSGSTSSSYAGKYMYAAHEYYGEGEDGWLDDGYTKYGTASEEDLYNLRYMWKLENAGDTAYYLINRATGLSPYRYEGYIYSYLVDYEDGVWDVDYVGSGLYTISFVGASYTYYLKPYGYYDRVVNYYSSSTDNYWQFVPVDLESTDEISYVTYPILNNNISVKTLPFSVDTWDGDLTVSEMTIDTDVALYTVKSVIYDESSDATNVELTLKDTYEAGEPFVLVAGDYTNYGGYIYVDESDTIDLWLPIPEDFTTTAGKIDGLVGNLVGGYMSETGLGYIDYDDDGIYFSITSSTSTYIGYNSGYFVETAETGDGDTDLIITFEGGQITAVKEVPTADEAAAAEAIYDLQGRQVAKAGKGIYIVGGKKVIYK